MNEVGVTIVPCPLCGREIEVKLVAAPPLYLINGPSTTVQLWPEYDHVCGDGGQPIEEAA